MVLWRYCLVVRAFPTIELSTIEAFSSNGKLLFIVVDYDFISGFHIIRFGS